MKKSNLYSIFLLACLTFAFTPIPMDFQNYSISEDTELECSLYEDGDTEDCDLNSFGPPCCATITVDFGFNSSGTVIVTDLSTGIVRLNTTAAGTYNFTTSGAKWHKVESIMNSGDLSVGYNFCSHTGGWPPNYQNQVRFFQTPSGC